MWLAKQFFRQQFYRKTSPHRIYIYGFMQLRKLSVQRDVNAVIEHVPEPEYNIDFICDPANRDVIFNNIKMRKGMGDIDKVLELSNRPELRDSLLDELSKIPNQTHPEVLAYGKEPRLLKEHGQKPEFDFKPLEFTKLVTDLQALRSQYLGPLIGNRGYMLVGDLADLEEALIHYTVKKLIKRGFKLVSVPDIIPTEVIERCGLLTDHGRTLVYNLHPFYGENYSLSGTAEMSLASKVMNTVFNASDLPLKMAAVSRCFRAEISNLVEEKGIYRVHQFTKVEMFVCSTQEESEKQFQELQDIEEDLFSSLNLHFKVLDMPPYELGAPAYRKVDMEGWMPGRGLYGELSSCSNCTDYQSRRLGIKYKSETGELSHVHTLNGTACAIPRMLIALCETYQTKHSRIRVPEILIPYMRGKELIKKQPVAYSRPYKCKSN